MELSRLKPHECPSCIHMGTELVVIKPAAILAHNISFYIPCVKCSTSKRSLKTQGCIRILHENQYLVVLLRLCTIFRNIVVYILLFHTHGRAPGFTATPPNISTVWFEPLNKYHRLRNAKCQYMPLYMHMFLYWSRHDVLSCFVLLWLFFHSCVSFNHMF